ncbi:hypothetical protein [Methylovorus glucosotrophus]|uniref:Uncharacterized protein n=1 Tax=Methylovorus glucosotrophus (strain SIP3-4) TaxID=582744 RepID=C6XE83_METGS|nr:hypothetical protein [Methylovorus glucosotrophus]ACT50858.1 hypothetical protein Msip34_1613 [Methylovorus glucosotrophus SIP3-4]
MENVGNDKVALLASGVLIGQTSIVLSASGADWPSENFRIRIDNELMLVTNKGAGSQTIWSVDRGIEGTIESDHLSGASVYQVLTAGGLEQFVADRLPAVELSTEAGQLIKYQGLALMVSKEDVAAACGLVTWESFIEDESYITPVYDAGDYIILGDKVFARRPISLNEEAFFYSPNLDLSFSSANIDLSNAVNNSTDWKKLGHVEAVGDVVRWAPLTTVRVDIEADGDLAGVTLGLFTSTVRIYEAHRIPKLLPTGQGSSATYILTLVPNARTGASQVTLGKIDDATGYTSLPNDSAIMDMNTIGNVGFPLYVQFPTSEGNLHITSCTMSLSVPRPVKNRSVPGVVHRIPQDQPYKSDDLWNLPMTTGAVVQLHHFSDNPASTGTSEVTGTLNAQGTAGSDVIFVYDSSQVKIGDYVAAGLISRFNGASPLGTVEIDDTISYNIFPLATKVIAIVDSQHVQLSNPVKIDFVRRGITSANIVRGLAFTPSAINYSVWMTGNQTAPANYSIQTGKRKKSTTTVSAKAYGDKAAIIRKVTRSDPIRQWTCTGNVVIWNPWANKIETYSSDNGGDYYTGLVYFMRTPDIASFPLVDSAARNKDANLALIMENGIYSHDSTRTREVMVGGVKTYTCSRAVFKDLTGYATPDILSRGHLSGPLSNGTRMTSDGLVAGLVRKKELDAIIQVADTTTINPATGVPYTLAEKVDIALACIPHQLMMVASQLQLMSEYYSPNVADQSTAGRVPFYSYYGQQERNRPVVAAATGTHSVGDVWQLKDGTYLEPMSVIIEAVNASGTPTKVFVGNCGQYYTRPTGDGNALVLTKMSGTGTTLSIDVLGLSGMPDVDTIAEAFPETWFRSTVKWPASSRDAAYDDYSGSIQPGALLTINPLRDLRTEAITLLTANPSSLYKLEYWAVLSAIQKYGLEVCDLASQTNHVVVFDWDLTTTQFNAACIETGSTVFTGMKYIKGQLVAVENVTPLMKGGVGTLKAPLAAQLFSVSP